MDFDKTEEIRMRVILDTNIIIHRENHHIVPQDIGNLSRILNEQGIVTLIHPLSVREIEQDPNRERRIVSLSKIAAYPRIENPPSPETDEDYLERVGRVSGAHDTVDINLLYALKRNVGNFLITEDKRIHTRAKRIGLDDRVLTVTDALGIFSSPAYPSKLAPPSICRVPVYDLEITDPFFDSLRKEYPDFDDWWAKISKQGRRGWIYRHNDGTIGALLITKPENEFVDSEPILPKGNRLKACTLKVAHTGYRIGELFIKLIIEECIHQGLSEAYLTHFTKEPDYLVDLISDYGFEYHGRKTNGEDVYIKSLIPPSSGNQIDNPFTFAAKYYPSFYEGHRVRKILVPIRPEYHELLFTDWDRQTLLMEYLGEMIIPGNTILKAYLCHSSLRRISRGDLLLFYRSEDSQLTTLGIVEDVKFDVRSVDEILRFVGKRTVYSREEIETIVRKPTTAILFRWHFHLPKPLSLKTMLKLGVLKGAPQTLQKMNHHDYVRLRGLFGIEERYSVN